MAEEPLNLKKTEEEEKKKKRFGRNKASTNRIVDPAKVKQAAEGSKGATSGDNSGSGVNTTDKDTGTSLAGLSNKDVLSRIGNRLSQVGPFPTSITSTVASKLGIIDSPEPKQEPFKFPEESIEGIGSAARGLVEESESLDARDLESTTELGVLNDPNTIRGSSDSDTIAAGDLQLQATSRISDDGTGTTFDFNDSSGSVATDDQEGAQRIASGLAVRGVQVPTFNTENLIASNRADEVQRIIREGKASGRPTEDILAQVRAVRARGGTRLGGDNSLQGQLDRVDELEESGALNSAFAQGRRNRINKQIASNQQGSAELSVSQFNAQTTRAKNVADALNKENKTKLERFNTINKLLTESGTSLGVVVQQFGVEGLNASQQALDLKPQLVQDMLEFKEPADRKDFAEQFLEDLGLPISNLNLVQEFVQG